MTALLALDLGTKTGWALRDAAGRITSGTQDFALRRGDSPGMRYLRFETWLQDLLAATAPPGCRASRELCPCPGPHLGLVGYEAPHHRGGAATEIALGFATRAQAWCATVGIEHTAVHSATLKKFTTGKGSAGKAAMAMAARRNGLLFNDAADDNEVDALCLLHYLMAGRG